MNVNEFPFMYQVNIPIRCFWIFVYAQREAWYMQYIHVFTHTHIHRCCVRLDVINYRRYKPEKMHFCFCKGNSDILSGFGYMSGCWHLTVCASMVTCQNGKHKDTCTTYTMIYHFIYCFTLFLCT